MFKKRSAKPNTRKRTKESDSEEEVHVVRKDMKVSAVDSSRASNVEKVDQNTLKEQKKNEVKPENRSFENVQEDAEVVFVDDGLYHGKDGYKTYIEKRECINPKMRAAGPIRLPSHMKTNIRYDYQPDICKDYKETGYCAFGDSCKFLHDSSDIRGDYKFGWQLDKEWEEKQKLGNDPGQFLIESEDEEDDDDDLPFACAICRDPFTDPIVTKCKHYFCEKCALKQFRKTKKCYVCSQPTDGQFTVAYNLIAKLEEKKKRLEEQRKRDEEENFE
ncbi:hypothetical protein ROZALSC1DRAFT_27895 [Rozella allomycis CSF55]|uniref:Pre-mRNA-splicing factor CWC24 n=1 Tax=Rozella allomycis (strain CSF55) TaxID=988480 RepID=A0A075AYS8_ROZAC|nr:Zinc finger, RING-type domain-containing protein [Rozella allomycis CSF55]RKP20642.1 hypothetical protein ROZALSC1DRAFT_27895 [Rozella allomycis CSF55]|eukprot:EPZ35279.1 Zinc finger, RING-type domain-containing protein [Rozella allomycis CSF55]